MKKKWFNDWGIKSPIQKWLRIMKLTFLILLISFMHLSASVYSQQSKLNVSLQNATVREVLRTIEDQSEFFFLYTNEDIDINRKVNVDVKDKSIENVLENIFKGTDVVYKISDRQVVLMRGTQINDFSQQQKSISGKVIDSSGLPLPGVSIIVKGTTKGTISDFDGKFTLGNVPAGGAIIFSFVGMKTQEVAVSGKTTIEVVMEEDAIGIEEVVAVGYGTVRRKDLTGSVASVSGSDLKDIPVASAAQAIVGKMAGVQVTKTEGSPDADIKIRIRGGGSLTQDNSPLYIVDGFPVGSINDIAPTDIESIDILKDASSTAIYGARGANGVILVTTKSGNEGKGKVSYNTYFGVKEIAKTLDVLNPYEYVLFQYELQNTEESFEKYFGDFRDFELYKQMDGTDWQNEIFGETGTTQYHNLSLSGGSKTSKYLISLTHNDEKEIMIGSGYSRTNLTFNTSNKIKDWLTVDLNVRLSDYSLKGAGTSANWRLEHAVQFRPINGLSDFVNPDLTNAGDYETSSYFIINPQNLTNDDYRRYKSLDINFNSGISIKLSENLNYRFEFGKQFGDRKNNRFYGINTSNAMDYGSQPLASIYKRESRSVRMANILNYSKKDILPGSNLKITLGEELNKFTGMEITSSAKYFPKYIDAVGALSMIQLGIPDPTTTYDIPDDNISSFFGRLNYDYKGKYLLTATYRADGSSKFSPNNRWGYFPSLGLGWRISDEQFLASHTEGWLSDLKLRASYGKSGNNRIPTNAWQKSFTVATGSKYSEGVVFMQGDGEGGSPTSFLKPNSVLSNPDLKWETTVTRNIGLDFGLFKQKLSGTVEVYKNTTKDLLISATIPSSTGYSRQWQNIGQTSNKGLEVSFNAAVVEKKDFQLSMSFNIGFNKNHIDKLGETKKFEQSTGISWSGAWLTSEYLIEEGGEIGTMVGFETEGMYTFDDFTFVEGEYKLLPGVSDNSALIVAKRFWPGALKLKDQNGDGMVDIAGDKVVIGNANPKHTGGFSLNAQYKGLDFSAFFNWVYGNDIFNANKLSFSTAASGRLYKNILDIFESDNRFSYIDKTTGLEVKNPEELAALNQNATMWSPAMYRAPFHSWLVEDGSFLRLNNLTIGYSLPKSLLSKYKIQKLRLYVTAYNLWTWTNYSGYDPEVDTQRSTPLTPGVDYCAYPRSRSFNVGLNLEF